MVRRWLGNDTWELLGGPVPPGAGSRAGQGDLVLAAVPGALAAAWVAAVRAAGPDPAQWRWGDVHRAVRVHPLAGAFTSAFTSAFASAAMGGDADTIQVSGYGWRPGSPFTVAHLSVYRQVVDLAEPASASFVIPGGASGDPASAHFSDQFARWADHQRIAMTSD
jgi:penicillin amidase